MVRRKSGEPKLQCWLRRLLVLLVVAGELKIFLLKAEADIEDRLRSQCRAPIKAFCDTTMKFRVSEIKDCLSRQQERLYGECQRVLDAIP